MHAHGEQAAASPWAQGSWVLFEEPACLMVLAAMALWLAPRQPPDTTVACKAGVAGLAFGTLLAAAGVGGDLTPGLLGLTLALGGLVAWGRRGPAAVGGALAAAAAAGVVLLLAPPVTAGAADRAAWLAGVLLVTALLFVNALGLLKALLGRKPGPVRRLLLRVAGSWLATAAVLALALDWSRRGL